MRVNCWRAANVALHGAASGRVPNVYTHTLVAGGVETDGEMMGLPQGAWPDAALLRQSKGNVRQPVATS